MKITNNDVILRYIKKDDIEDYKIWTTVETQWCDWDAPWEDDDWGEFLQRQKDSLHNTPEIFYKLEIDILSGQHIGWVSSYCIDGNEGKRAIGINIVPVGKGYGEKALSLFMANLFIYADKNILYTQTWSGNTPMLRLADKMWNCRN